MDREREAERYLMEWMVIDGLIERLIKTERNEIGYSPHGERAKYFSGIKPETSITAWCLIFQIYCMIKAFGEKNARRLMFSQEHWMYFVSALFLRYQEHGLIVDVPQKGDFVFFLDKDGIYNHIGLISEINRNRFSAIEGNVSDTVVEKDYWFGETDNVAFAHVPYWSIADLAGYWLKENGALTYMFPDGINPRNGWYLIDRKKYVFDKNGNVIREDEI